MRKLRFLSAAAAAALFALPCRAELVNGIKAIVHDSVITYVDVEDLTAQTADVLAREYRSNPSEFEKRMDQARSENLDRLLSNELILHEFKTAGYSLPDTLIDEVVQQRIRSRYGNRVNAIKDLQSRGLTFEKFRERTREQFIIEAMRGKNISSEILISPHKIETFYQANTDKFRVEDEIKLRMIVLNNPRDPSAQSPRKMAEEIIRKLQEGASFADMASVYSQGSQKNQGGDWGWVEKSVLRKELADVAFTLKPGQRSEIIETPEACYIMLVEDARPAHLRPLTEVRDQIEKNLMMEEQRRLEKQWLEKLRKKTFVRYF